jgi:transcriptional regulator with XRE-family HTH domain
MKIRLDKSKLVVLGQKCRAIREEYGLTQKDMGKRCGCTGQLISAFELGKTDSSIIYAEYLKLYSSYYSMDYFKEKWCI